MMSLYRLCFLLLFLAGAQAWSAPSNIVLILADDMGYGDPRCFNAQSKLSTPHIDRLEAEGMRFTDAHAPGSVCVPSRYGLMTGRFPFRNTGVKEPRRGALIEPGRATIATVLREAGYATAMIGKWHLGFDGGDEFDYSKPLRGGPVDHGFDSFFGQHASLDIPPYFYIKNDHAVMPASQDIEASHSPDWSPVQGAFWRAGRIAADYQHPDVLPTYTRKAVEYVREHGHDGAKPFFLYLALTAPHTPWLPMEEFRGKSAGGMYGDFVAQVDDSIGQVLMALDSAGLAKDTLVFFTSDNGPVWYAEDVAKFGHSAAGPWKGMKGDAWEAGHRMPFIARWPGKVKEGTTCEETICFTDFMATLAKVSGGKIPENAGEDSCDLTPLLLGEKHQGTVRDVTIHESSNGGLLCIRQGAWKLIPQLGSGGFSKPAKIKPKAGDPAGQLYNLAEDPGETKNRYGEKPEIVARLTELLEKHTTQKAPTRR